MQDRNNGASKKQRRAHNGGRWDRCSPVENGEARTGGEQSREEHPLGQCRRRGSVQNRRVHEQANRVRLQEASRDRTEVAGVARWRGEGGGSDQGVEEGGQGLGGEVHGC